MIKGKLVFLRALEPKDVDFLYRIENDPENWRISQTLKPFSRHTLTQFAESVQDIAVHNQVRLIICDSNDNTPIGSIDIFDYDPMNQRAGLGILIEQESNRNRGLGSEALELCLNYTFKNLLLHSVYCNVLEDNLNSISLFKKLGFESIGLKKDWIKTESGFKNEWIMQKIRK